MSNVLHISTASNSIAPSTSAFGACFTGSSQYSATETRSQIDVYTSGQASMLFIYISANTITAESSFKIRINTANTNTSLQIPGSTTGQFENTTDVVSFKTNEEVGYSLVSGAGGTSLDSRGAAHQFKPESGTVSYIGGNADFVVDTTSDEFTWLSGGASTTTQANHQGTIGTAATMKNMFHTVSANTRSDTVVFRTQKNGSNGNLACTFTTGATGDVTDSTNTDTVADGDELNYIGDQAGGTGSVTNRAQKTEFVTTNNSFPMFCGGPQAIGINATEYFFPAGSIFTGVTSEANVEIKSSLAFTWSDMYTYVSTNTIDITGTATIRSRKNRTNGNMLITYSLSATGQLSDTSNTDSITDDDEFNYSCVTAGISGTITIDTFSSLGTSSALVGSTGFISNYLRPAIFAPGKAR